MPRQQNFFYQSPMASITQSLGKALFGDPAAHDAQLKAQSEAALRAAQTGEATAHGGLYDSQSEGQRYQNTSAARQPADLEAWARSQFPSASPLATTIASTSADRLAPLPEAVAPTAPSAAPSEDPHVAGAVALSRVIASMTGAQGDKVDVPKTMSTLAAFLGGPNADTLGRGALIAGGHTPGKEFATDIPRADVIRDDTQAAGLARAMGVANVQAATGRRGQDINAGTQRRGQDISAGTQRRGQDIGAASSRYAGIKVNGTAPGFEAIQAVFPGLDQPNSGVRSAERNREVGGVAGSYHVPTNHPGAQAFDIPVQPGMTVDQAAAAIERANPGVSVVEKRDETGRVGPNGKALGGWHFALQGSGKSGRAGAAEEPPKGISPASDKMIADSLDTVWKEQGLTPEDRTKSITKAHAITLYQRSGNPEAAVRQAVADAIASSKRNDRNAGGGDLRAQANDAIGRGADPAAVAERYQKLTGKRFASGGST